MPGQNEEVITMSFTIRVAAEDAERLKKYAKLYESRGKAVHRALNIADQVTDEEWLVQVMMKGLTDADSAHLGVLDQVPTHKIAAILARTVLDATRATACQELGVSDDGRDRDHQLAS
jgi:predicted transcriptional regulator